MCVSEHGKGEKYEEEKCMETREELFEHTETVRMHGTVFGAGVYSTVWIVVTDQCKGGK